jgi:peptidoglycan/xylan/chitin deacetylase (PgdA/CDA1 family)
MKGFILQLLFSIGFFRIWLLFRPKSVTFLMLHGVMDAEDPDAEWLPFRSYLSRHDLDSTLKLLSQYYAFISIDEAQEKLDGEQPLDMHYCVFTFDDGQRNNVTHAMPVLRRYKAPAVLYVVPEAAEKQVPFWFDRLDYAMQQGFQSINEIEVFGKTFSLGNYDSKSLKKLFLAIKNEIFSPQHPYAESVQELARVIELLEKTSGKSLLTLYPDDPWSKIMDWEEIKQAALESDITIGSHSLDHSLMGKISETEARDQLVRSKLEIEERLQKPCTHFAYPNGSLPDNPSTLLEDSGYQTAVTTKTGITLKDTFNRYLIDRVYIDVNRGAFFNLALISGLLPTFSKLKKKIKFS